MQPIRLSSSATAFERMTVHLIEHPPVFDDIALSQKRYELSKLFRGCMKFRSHSRAVRVKLSMPWNDYHLYLVPFATPKIIYGKPVFRFLRPEDVENIPLFRGLISWNLKAPVPTNEDQDKFEINRIQFFTENEEAALPKDCERTTFHLKYDPARQALSIRFYYIRQGPDGWCYDVMKFNEGMPKPIPQFNIVPTAASLRIAEFVAMNSHVPLEGVRSARLSVEDACQRVWDQARICLSALGLTAGQLNIVASFIKIKIPSVQGNTIHYNTTYATTTTTTSNNNNDTVDGDSDEDYVDEDE